MEVFTFIFKPTRDSTEEKKLTFKSNCFFGAITKFYHHVSKHHPDFLLTQIRDQYGNRFYSQMVRENGCVRSGGLL